MMRRVIPLAALAVAAVAQDATSSYLALTGASSAITSSASLSAATGTASSSSTDGPYTHTVAVAKGGHKFTPDVVLAEVGDVIEYQFYPTNHSVIRAAYGFPCVPYEMVMGVGYRGFWSGWEPVDAVLANPPTYSVTVNDTDPIFFYCGAPNSCIGYEMVGVINPNASTSLQHQKDLAAQSTFALVPGEDWPTEGSIPSGLPSGLPKSSASSTSSTASTSTPTAASTSSAAATASESHGLGVGAIAGIAIGGAAVLLAAGIAVWFCGRRSNQAKAAAAASAAPIAPAQETNMGYHPGYANTGSMYAKPGHMSTVSGYGMPPNYEQGMRSPGLSATPVDPMMGQQQHMMHSGATSPMMPPSSPAYGHVQPVNMYAVGTHNIAPIEMSGEPSSMGAPRTSTEKHGAERYC